MNHLIPTGSTPPTPQPMPLIPTGSTPSRPQPMPLIPIGSTPPRPPPMPPIPTGSTPPTPPPMPPFPRGYIPPPPLRMPPIPRGSRPPPPPPMPPRRNLPCLDLLQGHRENYIKYGIPLYKAALKGDWTAAKPILHKRPNLVRCAITEKHETLLHIAASAESTKDMSEFVTNLVYLMDYKDLELQNINYDTPMTLAAAVGNIKAAAIMVQKNPKLTKIPGNKKQMPLNMAANFAKPDMVRHLYKISNKMSGEGWDDENRGWVLQRCVEAEIFDVAIQILSDQPKLLLKKVLVTNVLIALARKTDAFKEKKPHFFLRIINLFSSVFQLKQHHEKETKAVQVLRIIWKNVATMHKKKINEIIQGPLLTHKGKPGYPLRVLFLAVKMRNVRFIVELIQLYPDLIWKQDDKGKTIFHLAAKRHQIMIYKMLHEIGSMKDFITPIKDINENNMLHMVAKSAKPERFRYGPGVAFQMQEELLWFKAVQQVIPPEQTQSLNKDGKTPQDLFTKKHLDMVKDGERWLRDTSNQCMVVATLITTIVFAAAFTLPGGYNQNTGIPFFRKEPSLIIFVIADAISLVSSSTSILMFLSILTSRYAEHEFLKLPNQLVNGIATLFVSIISMMVAFSASFFVLYDKKVTWVYFTITSLASIPVIIYVMLQYPLFRDVIKSYFRSRNLFRQNKPILYY